MEWYRRSQACLICHPCTPEPSALPVADGDEFFPKARGRLYGRARRIFQMPLSSGGPGILTAAVLLCKQVGDTLL
jgi:hypothetical protein